MDRSGRFSKRITLRLIPLQGISNRFRRNARSKKAFTEQRIVLVRNLQVPTRIARFKNAFLSKAEIQRGAEILDSPRETSKLALADDLPFSCILAPEARAPLPPRFGDQ